MRYANKFRNYFLSCAVIGAQFSTSLPHNVAWAAPRKPAKTKPAPKPKAVAETTAPAILYDEEWSYRTGTLYGEKKNIVTGVSGNAKFNRDGTYEQNYYIGTIGNFFKGKYKINGDHLITYDEEGKKLFDFNFTIGTEPKILVLSVLNEDGTKSMDFSLVPVEKKKP